MRLNTGGAEAGGGFPMGRVSAGELPLPVTSCCRAFESGWRQAERIVDEDINEVGRS